MTQSETQSVSELPEGWTRVRLPEVADLKMGQSPPSSSYNASRVGLPFFQGKAEFGEVYPTPVKYCSAPQKIAEKADILISVRAPVGPTNICKEKSCIGRGLAAIRPRAGVNGHYVFYFLRSIEQWLASQGTGSTFTAISRSVLERIEVPLPPLNEQRRILATLEESLGKVNACQKRLAKIPVILKRFRQSVLAAACSGNLTADWRGSDNEKPGLPQGWERIALEELLEKGGIFDGPFGSNLKTEDYAPAGVRVVRLENIGHLRFVAEKETYITKEKYGSLIKHTVGYGDIIFSSFIADEIRACLLPQLETKAIAKADCFCLRPAKTLVNRRYLTFQLVSQESYSKLIESVHGATRPRINTTQLRKLHIRICPLQEQREIVSRVEALFKFADQIEERHKKAQAQVDKLPQSILGKAFRGELVPTEAELARRKGRSAEKSNRKLEAREDLNS